MRPTTLLCCCLLLAPCAIRAGTSPDSSRPPDFSGNWIASDQPDDAAAATKPNGDNSTHGHGGHGGGAGGMGGGGHGMGGGSHGGRGNNTPSTANSSTAASGSVSIVPREHAQSLIIRPSDDVFDIEANSRRMAYRFDGKHNYGPQYGGTVALTWAAPELVIETHPDGGGASVEEHYSLSSDGKKLSLLIRNQRDTDGSVQETRHVFVRRDENASTAKLP